MYVHGYVEVEREREINIEVEISKVEVGFQTHLFLGFFFFPVLSYLAKKKRKGKRDTDQEVWFTRCTRNESETDIKGP